MALITIGNNHLTATLQEGYVIDDDTYGLFTGSCVFEIDQSMVPNNSEAIPNPGDPHPDSRYAFMLADKRKRVFGSGGKVRVTVNYVGVLHQSPYGEDGSVYVTSPQATGNDGTSTEPIENHPHFWKPVSIGDPPVAVYAGDPIAGVGTGTSAPIAPVFPQSTRPQQPQDKNTYYQGNHGSQFIDAAGSRFVAFADPAFPKFYGKKSFLNRVTSWSGVIYTTSTPLMEDIRNRNASTLSTNKINGVKILPTYYGETFVAIDGTPQLLLTNVGTERYSTSVYKITYTIRYNIDGFPTEVYAV
jgi:hypothetical protein